MADLKISALTASTTPLAGTEVLPIVQSSTTKQVSVANLTAGRAMSALSGSFGTGASAYSISGTQISATNTSANTYLSVYAGAGAATQGGFLIGANNTENQANILWVESGNYLQVSANPVSSTLKMIAGGATVGTFQSTGLAMPNGLGIDFSATAGTGTSELLADYEEGTFTPTMFFGATQIDTYNAQNGWYTKTGNSVFFTIFIQLRTKGAGTGSVTVRNLPFTSQSSTSHRYSFSVTGQNLTLLTGALFGTMDENTTQVSIFQSSATGGTALTDAVFADFSSDNIIVTGTYQV
jgi:hypothetical protein